MPLPLPHPSLVLLLLATCSQLTNASCFLPNGTDINRLRLGPVPYDRWLPCNNNGGMCCRLNDTNPDTCTDQGLCHNDVAPTLWRESCTERDWGGACLQLCVGASGINTGNPNWPNGTPLRNSHVPLTQCQDGSLCCGYNNTNCCSRSQGSFIVNGQVSTSNPSSSTTTTTGTSATSSPASSSPSTSSRNTGAIAGGVVGGVVGLLVVLGAVWWGLRGRKRGDVDTVDTDGGGGGGGGNGVAQQAPRPGFSEMDSSEQQMHELVGGRGVPVGYKKVRQSSLGEVHELDGGAGGR
ncbi:hypothetical protein EG328_005710 [Venturia inaequalis]|uniref:Mid2 domain-containing protein n=1 Tax=Venturia inaequalis TaxID=5025 RepID=A0A8H3YS50_VENIN|nr:hypothetical protein EG328_005710 [Venturia inaequalis]KAE9977856.1 hypothetical protein EG327_007584 [Venturia inaequalis]RDI87102.1 hypothetical protein Vi05172_g2730 [Venturia inaequalis]